MNEVDQRLVREGYIFLRKLGFTDEDIASGKAFLAAAEMEFTPDEDEPKT